jgi:hypothetical protein
LAKSKKVRFWLAAVFGYGLLVVMSLWRGQGVEVDLPSLRGYLSVADLGQFRPGRSKDAVLEDLQWRVRYVEAGKCEGKSIMVLDYSLLVDPSNTYKSKGFHAIFVDGKFEKLVKWVPGTAYKPAKVGDCRWLLRVVNDPAVSVDDLRKAAESQIVPKKDGGVGLTVVFVLLSPLRILRAPTAEDYKRNGALRDQFNAGRLDIGMTEAEVEHVLNAKPLESGQLEAGSCKVYGSDESFPIDFESHFRKVVAVFREGKAIAIFDFSAGGRGRHEAPNGVIDYLKQQDAAAAAAGY